MTTTPTRAYTGKVLTQASINPQLVKAQYAVRGRIPQRAEAITQDLPVNPGKYPFKKTVACNIGNPQALNQKPMTFFREVLALLDLAPVKNLEDPAIRADLLRLFAPDAIDRAVKLSKVLKTGAYTDSQGVLAIRKTVAQFLLERDGVAIDPKDLFLSNGASECIQQVLGAIIASQNVGIMIPIPQYPLYTATIDLLNGTQVPYFLDEANTWGLNIPELERSLAAAKAAGADTRALVVINPGNPTGAMMSEANIRDVINFAHRHRLVLLVDEVYQVNCYESGLPFVSFRKVLSAMDKEIAESQELFSFHSVSKGVIGECGRRGGFMGLTNIAEEVREQLVKRASLSLCSNVPGQVMVDLMVSPPKPGDFSYEGYQQEFAAIFESLKRRGQKLSATLNTLEGVFCHPTVSSMYAFPAITLPKKAVAVATASNIAPDEFYCAELLEKTGVCVVPGSGFLQREGTYHFRTTFLPPEDQMDQFLASITTFHQEFLSKYKD